MRWKLVSDGVPDCEDILVCVTYNLDDREYETKQWVDSWFDEIKSWMVYGERIDIPFPPTHWMPLPKPPVFS